MSKTTEAKPNLYQRINSVMADVQYLQKDDSVGTGNYAYKAISIEKVVEAVRAALIRHGLVIMPVEQLHVMEDKQRVNNNGHTTIVPITTVDVKYKVVNIDNPAEFEIVVSSGTGVDPQDKGAGKAMTYAYKNLLLKLFAIPTGDDTDKTHSKDLEEQQNKAAALAAAEDAKPVTDALKREIENLVTNEAITEEDEKKTLAALPKLTQGLAKKTIIVLKKKIALAAEQTAKEKH